MPELPEVETVRGGLERLVEGTVVERVEVFRQSCVRLHAGGATEFAAELTGASLRPVVRRGKFLWMPLEDEDGPTGFALSAHLGVSGQFRSFAGAASPPHPHCRARLHLQGPRGALTLDFVDQRTFGYLVVEPLEPTADGGPGGRGSESATVPRSVAHIGRDALDPLSLASGAHAALRRGSRGIKQVLLDQTAVSGIGNIYADEALWWARIHPATPASALSDNAVAQLFDSVREVMERALAQGGTSFDALYVNVNGESGQLNIALKRVEVSRRQVISQSDLVRQALTKRLESPTCSAAHRRSFGSRSLRGASHA